MEYYTLPEPFQYLLHDYALIAAPILYLVWVIASRSSQMAAEKNGVPATQYPKIVSIVYNAIQVALSCYMAYGIFGPGGFNFSSVFGINTQWNAQLEYFGFVHYLSKYFDFVDTFFILQKRDWRRLNFLHIYHHASIPIVWGFLLSRGVCNGTALFGAGINSVIHALMYSHYFITSIGLNNPFKAFITQAQLIQFVMCEAHVYFVVTQDTSPVAKHPYTTLQVCYHITMISLFTKFYIDTYCSGKPTQRPQAPKQKST